jgi:phenylacetate-coenzyme A ligase PaaK-like adenylate-forming protein
MSKNCEARKREAPTTVSTINDGVTHFQPIIPSLRANQLPIINDRIKAIGATTAETCQLKPKQIMTERCVRQKTINKIAVTDQ